MWFEAARRPGELIGISSTASSSNVGSSRSFVTVMTPGTYYYDITLYRNERLFSLGENSKRHSATKRRTDIEKKIILINLTLNWYQTNSRTAVPNVRPTAVYGLCPQNSLSVGGGGGGARNNIKEVVQRSCRTSVVSPGSAWRCAARLGSTDNNERFHCASPFVI